MSSEPIKGTNSVLLSITVYYYLSLCPSAYYCLLLSITIYYSVLLAMHDNSTWLSFLTDLLYKVKILFFLYNWKVWFGKEDHVVRGEYGPAFPRDNRSHYLAGQSCLTGQHVSLPGKSVLSHHGTTGLITWQVRPVSRKQQVSIPGRSVLSHGTTCLIINIQRLRATSRPSLQRNGLDFFFQGSSCLLDWADWSGELTGKRVLELGSGLKTWIRMLVTCIEKLHFIFQVSFNT